MSIYNWTSVNSNMLCSGPSWIYRVGKRPPVKADLAIYGLMVGMPGQWEDVATMLNIKLDFCCDNSVDFCKSSHIYSRAYHFLLFCPSPIVLWCCPFTLLSYISISCSVFNGKTDMMIT